MENGRVVLIKSEQFDQSTDQVIDWIYYLGGNPIRVDSDDCISDVDLNLESGGKFSFTLGIDKRNGDCRYIHSKDIGSFWYRRGGLNFKVSQNFEHELKQIETNLGSLNLLDFVKNEWIVLRSSIFSYLTLKRWSLGNSNKSDLNKLEVLRVAGEVGLKFPKTVISNSKEKLTTGNFKKITKSIWNSPIFQLGPKRYNVYTSEITDEKREKLADNFFPSLVQEKIDKKYELRIFYLNGICYSSAIFSQSNPGTMIDFRNYDWENPNRVVPYKLPGGIEKKIDWLMRRLSLNTGSIDMIVTPKGDYYFLEVNPVGQFGMVSIPCNYQLEKTIAEYLLAHET